MYVFRNVASSSKKEGSVFCVQSQSHFATDGLLSISSSWRQSPWRPTTSNLFQLNTCGYSPYITSSLTRRWVCRLQLLLLLPSAVVVRSESCGNHDHILLSQIRNSTNLEVQVLVFYPPPPPRNRVAQLYPQAMGFPFVASYDS
jgi:hypothetical protein